ncbi:hypothetical protein [Sulfuracidifex tepidarius]|uniref:hypothetical protein n=1 Tax=Sulfuracidifex tepidarius TaxID=1294262 RepID=UPI0011F2AB1B|nr:hypothetical protein [Sulfuracidifex tepidarius]
MITLTGTVSNSTDYGYEFGYVYMNGIQSIINVYNCSVSPGSPPISIQENTCLNADGTYLFVQNVVYYYLGETCWETSIEENGNYVTSYQRVEGNTFNLTTTWDNESGKLEITFMFSNFTWSSKVTRVVDVPLTSVVYVGRNAGTVIGGYGNSLTSTLGKGFNVSIREYFEWNGKWYVPPVAFSGYQITGESAENGSATFYDGKVWVTHGDAGVQELYNYSVVVVNGTFFTFPPGSLWYADGIPFVNSTSLGSVAPFCFFNHSFSGREIRVVFSAPVMIDGVVSRVFYLPSPETVYLRNGTKCEPMYFSSNVTVNPISNASSSSSTRVSKASVDESNVSVKGGGISLPVKVLIFILFVGVNLAGIIAVKRPKKGE